MTGATGSEIDHELDVTDVIRIEPGLPTSARAPTTWAVSDPDARLTRLLIHWLKVRVVPAELCQRLCLVDVPERMSMRTLAITVTGHESRFEEIVEEAQPIIDSIEFNSG